MSSSLSYRTLGDVLDLVIDHRGKTPKKLGGDFEDSGVPVVSAIHIKGGQIKWDERERFVSFEMYKKWMPQKLQKGDLLLTSEAPLGELALVSNDEPLVLSQRLFALRAKHGVLEGKYLYYFLQSQHGQQILNARSSGTTVTGIRQSELVKIEIPVPSIEDQRRIVGVLGALDDLIQLNISLAASLKAMVEARFQAILSTPSTRQKLGTVIDLKYGKALPARERREGTVAVVSSAGIVDVHDEMLVNGPGIVVGRKGTVGSITWVDSDFFPIDTAFYVESNMPLLFVYFSLKQLGLDRMNTDSAVPGLNRNNALSQEITVPSNSEVGNFSEFATPLWTTASQLDSENVQLARIRNELLPLLLTGAIKVKEVAA